MNLPHDLPPIEAHPPAADELEISLFGPGVGECVVVHLGNDRWMIVDSCRNPVSKQPSALEYLDHIGVNPGAVELIVVSHWHDDHIGDAAKVVSYCTSARVCYSAALLKEEFLTLVSTFSDPLSLVDRARSGAREMASIVRHLEERTLDHPSYKLEFMVPTTADRVLYLENNNAFRTEVKALSPSNAAFNNALMEFKSLIPSQDAERRVIPRPTQNHNAIAIWIQFGLNNVLLGSDLEETSVPYTGWSAIVNSPTRPPGKAKIFKIPHHGSKTGHSDDVWNQMVETHAAGVLTTYSRSSIPSSKDVSRMKQFIVDLFCTTPPKAKPPKRDRAVERTLKGLVKQRRSLGGDIGQIQVRMSLAGQTTVNAKPPAKKL